MSIVPRPARNSLGTRRAELAGLLATQVRHAVKIYTGMALIERIRHRVILALVAAALLSAVGSRAEESVAGGCSEGEPCWRGEEEEEGLVAELTDENFMKTVHTSDMIVVQFYAPW